MLDFIALDLEGTLISNAMSQIPRPGLNTFIEACAEYTDKIVLYSAVSPAQCRSILQTLANENDVPAWFALIEIVIWDFKNHSAKKDLTRIQADWSRGILVDDIEDYVEEKQMESWIPIKQFDGYTEEDNELARIAKIIEKRAMGY